MKRRKAVQNLALITGGLALMPACSVDEKEPVFDQLPLEPGDVRLVTKVADAILPKADIAIETPEPTAHFILNMVNDCYQEKEITRFTRGLKLFKQVIKDEYQKPFGELNAAQHNLLFTEITHSDIYPKSLKFFLSTMKRLTVRHFTSSSFFMSQKLDFEFAPGRYIGCKDLTA